MAKMNLSHPLLTEGFTTGDPFNSVEVARGRDILNAHTFVSERTHKPTPIPTAWPFNIAKIPRDEKYLPGVISAGWLDEPITYPTSCPLTYADGDASARTKPSLQEKEMIEITSQFELDASLADLAADLTLAFSKAQSDNDAINFVTLRSPMLLTVEKKGKGYTKEAHIGQEEFIPIGAYVGKKGNIILKFKPREAAHYEFMEMTANEGLEMLEDMSYFMELPEGTYYARIADLNTAKSAIRDQVLVKDKFEQYQHLGFGTF